MARPWRWRCLLLASWFFVAAAGLQAQQVTYSGGMFYAGGSYVFDRRTDAFFLSNGLRLTVGRLELSATVPLIAQNGGVVTQVAGGTWLPTGGTESGAIARRQGDGSVGTRRQGGGMMPTPDSTTVVFDESYSVNVGDPSMSVSVEAFSGFGSLRSVRISASAKAPLADVESGVGSGAWDFSLGGALTVGVGSALLFADASYWWLGDLPDLELIDGVAYGFGVSVPAFAGSSLLLMLSGTARSIETVDPPLSLLGSLSRSVGSRTFLSGGLGVGLTESAPDVAVHLGWSVRLSSP